MSANAQSFDVVVVGCGIAGLAAAMAARQQGASVAILERAPVEERGGNTRHTGAWMRMKNDAEVSDDFEEHFAANSGGYIDPSLLKRAVEATEMQPRGMAQPVRHPERGEIRVQGLPAALSRTPGAIRRAAPPHGEHTDEILRELGYRADEIVELKKSGAV